MIEVFKGVALAKLFLILGGLALVMIRIATILSRRHVV